MINVDISRVWGAFSLPDLLALEKEIFDAHVRLDESRLSPDSLAAAPEVLERLQAAAASLRAVSDICVVVSSGAEALAARAAIELLQGTGHNLGKGKGNPQLLFAGDSLSTRRHHELLQLLEGKDFTVIVISTAVMTAETAHILQTLRRLLEARYGAEKADSRITAVTGSQEGKLPELAQRQGWECFVFPVRERLEALSEAALLPMAVAGIDIAKVLQGGMEALQSYSLRSFENALWLYTVVRELMRRCGKRVELLTGTEPCLERFAAWWRQLFARAEGSGLYPAFACLPADGLSLAGLIRSMGPSLFETVLRFDPPAQTVPLEWNESPEPLSGATLDCLEEQHLLASMDNHEDSGSSIILMDCGRLDPEKVGELFAFMELSCRLTALMHGENNEHGLAERL